MITLIGRECQHVFSANPHKTLLDQWDFMLILDQPPADRVLVGIICRMKPQTVHWQHQLQSRLRCCAAESAGIVCSAAAHIDDRFTFSQRQRLSLPRTQKKEPAAVRADSKKQPYQQHSLTDRLMRRRLWNQLICAVPETANCCGLLLNLAIDSRELNRYRRLRNQSA